MVWKPSPELLEVVRKKMAAEEEERRKELRALKKEKAAKKKRKAERRRKNRAYRKKNVKGKFTYKKYLRSPHWREFRQQVIHEAGGRCGHCGSEENLEVHHLHYRSLFREKLEDVELVCRSCHQDIHNGEAA